MQRTQMQPQSLAAARSLSRTRSVARLGEQVGHRLPARPARRRLAGQRLSRGRPARAGFPGDRLGQAACARAASPLGGGDPLGQARGEASAPILVRRRHKRDVDQALGVPDAHRLRQQPPQRPLAHGAEPVDGRPVSGRKPPQITRAPRSSTHAWAISWPETTPFAWVWRISATIIAGSYGGRPRPSAR
jgi:hypothetical protein